LLSPIAKATDPRTVAPDLAGRDPIEAFGARLLEAQPGEPAPMHQQAVRL
jgi:hypothetical protein